MPSIVVGHGLNPTGARAHSGNDLLPIKTIPSPSVSIGDRTVATEKHQSPDVAGPDHSMVQSRAWRRHGEDLLPAGSIPLPSFVNTGVSCYIAPEVHATLSNRVISHRSVSPGRRPRLRALLHPRRTIPLPRIAQSTIRPSVVAIAAKQDDPIPYRVVCHRVPISRTRHARRLRRHPTGRQHDEADANPKHGRRVHSTTPFHPPHTPTPPPQRFRTATAKRDLRASQGDENQGKRGRRQTTNPRTAPTTRRRGPSAIAARTHRARTPTSLGPSQNARPRPA